MEKYAKTAAVAAKALNIHSRTLHNYLNQGAPGKVKGKGYDLEALQAWREANVKTPAKPNPMAMDEAERMTSAKIREAEAKADKVAAEAVIAEYKVLTLKEDLCHVKDVENWIASALVAFRNEIQKIPAVLASGYAPEIQHQLEQDIRERLDISLRALHSRLNDITKVRDDDD